MNELKRTIEHIEGHGLDIFYPRLAPHITLRLINVADIYFSKYFRETLDSQTQYYIEVFFSKYEKKVIFKFYNEPTRNSLKFSWDSKKDRSSMTFSKFIKDFNLREDTDGKYILRTERIKGLGDVFTLYLGEKKEDVPIGSHYCSITYNTKANIFFNSSFVENYLNEDDNFCCVSRFDKRLDFKFSKEKVIGSFKLTRPKTKYSAYKIGATSLFNRLNISIHDFKGTYSPFLTGTDISINLNNGALEDE